jgi:uncharacterized protein YkwD
MRFLARLFSYTPCSNRLSAPEPSDRHPRDRCNADHERGKEGGHQRRQEMLSINVAIVLVALISPAHADEQNATVQTDTAAIPPAAARETAMLDVTGDNPAVLISAFRHQHGEDSVIINAALTRIAQEQANAMAARDSLDHNALAPFSHRIGRSGLSRAAENIAYGYADFASTLKQWTNSAGHRANLLLHGARWIGVAHAQNGHRTYWAMVIGAK